MDGGEAVWGHQQHQSSTHRPDGDEECVCEIRCHGKSLRPVDAKLKFENCLYFSKAKIMVSGIDSGKTKFTPAKAH